METDTGVKFARLCGQDERMFWLSRRMGEAGYWDLACTILRR